MSIDRGLDKAGKLLEAGHVKTTANGFIFTREGLNHLVAQIEKLGDRIIDLEHTVSLGSESGEGDTV